MPHCMEVRIIRRIRRLFNDDPTRWSQTHEARDKHGKKCYTESRRAVAWSLYGAHYRVNKNYIIKNRKLFRTKCLVHEFNNNPKTTFADVLSQLDKAEKYWRKQER